MIQQLNKAELDVYRIFKVLKDDAQKYKSILNKNEIDISGKDKEIIEILNQDLEEAEKYFTKRIEKIESGLE